MVPNLEEIDHLSLDELREKGNECTRNENFHEALRLYTKAINICPNDARLFSNRSLVNLRLKEYYCANKDADMAIQLNQNWAKAHFRKAEIYSAIGYYDTALLSYGRAIAIQPGDKCLLKAAQKAATYSNQQNEYELRLPWVGSGIGIIIGVMIALGDHFYTTNPSIKHPALMVFLVFLFACIGYVIAKTVRYYQRLHKKSLLDPQTIFLDENQSSDETECSETQKTQTHSNKNRYTKAQARMKFKKGKS